MATLESLERLSRVPLDVFEVLASTLTYAERLFVLCLRYEYDYIGDYPSSAFTEKICPGAYVVFWSTKYKRSLVCYLEDRTAALEIIELLTQKYSKPFGILTASTRKWAIALNNQNEEIQYERKNL